MACTSNFNPPESEMRHLGCIFFWIMLAFSFGAIAGTDADRSIGLKLSLEKRGENFVVLIENDTGRDVKINKEFSLDPLVGSIHFVVTLDGKVRNMTAQVNPVPLSENSYINLQSGGIYGHLFEISHFEKIFSVDKLCYKVGAYYQDGASSEFHSYDGKIVSNQISVCNK